MALVESIMVPLGAPAPSFELTEPSSYKTYSLSSLARPKGLLVMFICNHCPYVKHIEYGLLDLGKDYADSEIGIVAINSNDASSHPADSPENMAEKEYPFPYLFDATQEVAKRFEAECTPDFFLYDGDLNCVYRGEFDRSRPGNGIPVTGGSLRAAMNALLAGKPIVGEQHPSIGCNIKWKT